MSIKHQALKIKSLLKTLIVRRLPSNILRDALFVGIIATSSLASYILGTLSYTPTPEHASPIVVTESTLPVAHASTTRQSNDVVTVGDQQGMYVASRNGTKYHFPWCPGARSIKEENKVWFTTASDARAAGYEPAANCKGID